MQSRTISTADLANLLATTPKTIATYAKAGVVKRRGRGKYDEVASVRGFAKHMRARPKGASASSSVTSERAGLLSVQRRRAELELAKAKGDLQSRTELTAQVRAHNQIVRNELLRIKSTLLNSSVTHDVAEFVDEKIREALTNLANNATPEDREGSVEVEEENHADRKRGRTEGVDGAESGGKACRLRRSSSLPSRSRASRSTTRRRKRFGRRSKRITLTNRSRRPMARSRSAILCAGMSRRDRSATPSCARS